MLTLDTQGLPHAGGRLLKLPPKERAALRLLWSARPEVVRKDEFAAAAWAGRLMSDESLARCISRVRHTLKPMGLRVEAWYGLGYRLLEPIPSESQAPVPSAQSRQELAHARLVLQQRTPAAVSLAVELLRGLVRNEPRFAAARVALAEALVVAVGWGQLPTPAAVEEGLAALALPHGNGEPGEHAARGGLLDFAWRFAEARACFDQALVADGDEPETLLAFARHLLYTDDAVQAASVLRRVRTLAPHALHPRIMLARALVQSGRGSEAVAEIQAALLDHPGMLVLVAFSLALQAMVAPRPDMEAAVKRLTQGVDVTPFYLAAASYVLARLGRREASLEIVDAALLRATTTVGEAALYAAPLAALGEFDRAAELLRRAVDERSGMMALMLRDPAHTPWLPHHPIGRTLLRAVYGG